MKESLNIEKLSSQRLEKSVKLLTLRLKVCFSAIVV